MSERHWSLPPSFQGGTQLLLSYMASMRWVTRKPPKILTLAITSAAKPKQLRRPTTGRRSLGRLDADREQRADHDHRRDRVGHRHQRRMQRGRHAPHHVIADEDREHEDREAEHEGIMPASTGASRVLRAKTPPISHPASTASAMTASAGTQRARVSPWRAPGTLRLGLPHVPPDLTPLLRRSWIHDPAPRERPACP